MQFRKILKLSLSVLIAAPLSAIIGNEILANNLTGGFDYQIANENLIACGGGGGGGGASPAAKAAAAKKKAKAKLSFKKRALAKKAAAGEDTTALEAQIAELETLIAK